MESSNNPPADAETIKNEFDKLSENMTSLETEKTRLEEKGINGFHRQYNSVERKIKKLNKEMIKKSKQMEEVTSGDFKAPEKAKL